MPGARPGEVVRQRLRAVVHGSGRPVVLHAPAGYGKTTLAAQWCRQDARRAAWLTLRRADTDPVVLLSHLSRALEAIDPLDPGYEEMLRTHHPSPDRATARLLDRFARHQPLLLALDDVDRVAGSESCEIVHALVASVPQGSQVVLMLRSDAGLPLARLHVTGAIRELRGPDLAFTVQETAEVLRGRGITVTDREIERLHHRTEGWPAAVALAGTTARSTADRPPAPLLPHRAVSRYLQEEVLADEDPAVRSFLLQTSFLSRLSPPLCDAVTLRTDSGPILADLERRDLFVRPLDDEARWYRYHRLWRRFLGSQLERSGQDVTELRGRAAAWHEHHGDPGQSFRLACQAGDLDRAGRVLLRHHDDYTSRGLIGSLRGWVRRCSEQDVEADPQLAIAGGWIGMLSGDFERATRYLAAAQRHDLDRPSADGSSSLRAAMVDLRAALGVGGAEQMLADGRAVIESEGPGRTRRLVDGYRAAGTAHLVLGQGAQALAAFGEVLFLTAGQQRSRHPRAFSLGCMALVHADLGDWEGAAACIRQAEHDGAPSPEGPLDLPLAVARAVVDEHLDPGVDGGLVLPAVVEATEGARAIPWLEAEMALRCSGLAQRAGNRKLAGRALAHAQHACLHMEEPGVLLRRVQRQRSLLLRGDAVVSRLTPAERRVAEQLETHRTLKEIGEHLYISRATVKTHVSAIYTKLGVAARGEAVAWLQGHRDGGEGSG